MTLGCEERRHQSQPSPSKPAAVLLPAPSVPSSKKSASIATKREVETALGKWVSAQNKADFEKYEAHYFTRFTGIKRAHERTYKQNRATWMTDRKAMFEKPFVVTMSNVKVQSAPGIMIATFEQSFKSDTFHDRGKKRMIFVKDGAHLRITREEMLSSSFTKSEDAPGITFLEAAVAERTIDSTALLIPGTTSLTWATGHPRHLSNERAQRAVATKALPQRLLALLDDSYEVFDADGSRCEVKPRGFQLLVHVIPHFGTVQEWDDTYADHERRPKRIVPPEVRALDLWHMAVAAMSDEVTPGIYLGLEMEPSKCRDPVWGRQLRQDAPKPWNLRVATEKELSLVDRAIASHVVVRGFDTQARKESPASKGARWGGGVEKESVVVVSDGGDKEFLYARVWGSGGCSSNNPTSVGLVFRKYGARLSPIQHPVYFDSGLRAAVDLNVDGEPEFVTKTTIVQHTLDGYRHVIDHSELYLSCDC